MATDSELGALRTRAWVIGSALFILPAVVALVVYVLTPANSINKGFTDATAAITFISAAAVAIERALEGFWSLVNMRTPWWPMSAVTAAVRSFEDETNTTLAAPLATLESDLRSAVQIASDAGKDVTEAQAALSRFQEAAADAKRRAALVGAMAPGNERLGLTTGYIQAAADAAAEVFQKAGADVTEAGKVLGTAAALGGSATDFVASFRENPARRVLSLSLGATIGLAVSGLFGLNIFVAAAAAPAADTGTPSSALTASTRLVADAQVNEAQVSLLDGVGGVVLTGLIIGFGSGPTHEVIRLVQESKRNRKSVLPVGPTTDAALATGKAEAPALPTKSAADQGGGGAMKTGDVVFEHSASTQQMLRPTRLTSTD